MYSIPWIPSRIVFVEKLVWQPDPFQSLNSLGAKEIVILKSSATRCRMYLEIHS